jgi:hypothetical protein
LILTFQRQIKDFFQGILVKDIQIPRNAAKKPIGVAYAEFVSEKDLEQALRRNKSFIGTKKVFLKKAEGESVAEGPQGSQLKPWEAKVSLFTVSSLLFLCYRASSQPWSSGTFVVA